MTTQAKIEYDLFISHANADGEWVEGYLLDALDAARVKYTREETFLLGVPRLTEFERSVKQSKRTLLILTPAYLADDDTQFVDLLVTTFGLETSTWPVIPLLLKPVSLPTRLAMLTRLDAIDQEEWPDAIQKLCRELGKTAPSSTTIPECPYPGMRPFSELESPYFYGREAEIEEMLQRLRQHPFLTVIGPSGGGKSSLVFAGLIPALRLSTLFGRGGWLVYSLRPGEQPLTALTTALNITKVEQFGAPSGVHVLVIVDQFEELFTLRGTEAGQFIEALQKLSKISRGYVILTVRADFFADLMTLPLWPEIQRHRLEVTPPDEAGLRAAIIKPAESLGIYIESALIERLVANAAGQPGMLPFLQEVLVLLWAKIERRFLPVHAYEALVLPYKTISGEQRTGLQVALARKADQIFADLNDDQQIIAKRIFLRLVQFGEGRTHTRRQQPIAALRSAREDKALFEKTLQYLADNRLLTLSGNEQKIPKADLSHEAMIIGWPRLSRWIAEQRAGEEIRRQLESKATEWIRLGRGEGGLLDATEWQEAVAWLNTTNIRDFGVSVDLLDLVKASQATLNPGWHPRGAVILLGGLLAFVALAGWSYYTLNFIGAPAAMTAATFSMVGLITLIMIFAWVNARRANPYLLQKMTHYIAKHRPLWLGLALSLIAVAGLWGLVGRQMIATESQCNQLGFAHISGIDHVAVVKNNFDPLRQHLFVLMVARAAGYQMIVKQLNAQEAATCHRFMAATVTLEERTSDNPNDTLYIAWVTQMPNGETPDPIQVPVGADGCGAMTRLAYQFVQRQGYPAALDKDFAADAPKACTPLVSYEEGYRHYVRDEYVDAEQAFRRALAAAPEYTLAHSALAFTLSALGKHEPARQEIATAMQLLHKPYPLFYGYLGAICLRAKDFPCAEEAYQQAIRLKPQSFLLTYYNGLASTYTEWAKYDQAAQNLGQAAALMTANPAQLTASDRIRLLKNQGILAFRRGEPAAARIALTEADKLSQSSLEQLQDLLPQQFVEETRYNLALRTIQKLDEESVYYLSWVEEAQQQPQQACNWWRRYETIPASAFFQEQERRTDARLHMQQLNCH